MNETSFDQPSGIVLEIQRLSTEDGPGIRSTIFMKGCSLRCQWCHNPESISPMPQLQWIASRCIGCKSCLSACPNSALIFESYGIEINRLNCRGCGTCTQTCPSNALELMGKKWTASELVKEVLKDRVFFQKSGGGVTLSGGESTLQYSFVAEVLRQLKAQDIHTALDTCGMTSQTAMDTVLPYSDLVLYDLKEMDSNGHRMHTGSPNEKILEMLLTISEVVRRKRRPAEIWIRTPIIPQATDYPDNISAIGNFIQTHCADVVTRWDLLAFNNLCKDKYTRLGLEWVFSKSDLITRDQQDILLQAARESLVNPDIVHWSGNTQLLNADEPSSSGQPYSYTSGTC